MRQRLRILHTQRWRQATGDPYGSDDGRCGESAFQTPVEAGPDRRLRRARTRAGDRQHCCVFCLSITRGACSWRRNVGGAFAPRGGCGSDGNQRNRAYSGPSVDLSIVWSLHYARWRSQARSFGSSCPSAIDARSIQNAGGGSGQGLDAQVPVHHSKGRRSATK